MEGQELKKIKSPVTRSYLIKIYVRDWRVIRRWLQDVGVFHSGALTINQEVAFFNYVGIPYGFKHVHPRVQQEFKFKE